MFLTLCASQALRSVSLRRMLSNALLTTLFVVLTGCATNGQLREVDYFPGNSSYYSFGVVQSEENFVNVNIAQVAKGLYLDQRTWGRFGPGISPGTVSMIRSYFPFSMRWELKDGRQFILENINVRSIMKEYFKDRNNDITLPWQREGRPKHHTGDAYPALVYEVKDNLLRLKWLISINETPVEKRILPSGAATKWEWKREQYLIVEIEGMPTQGIDFDQKWEFQKGHKRIQ